MRKKIIAGNWKMHFTTLETEKFLKELSLVLENKSFLEWVVFPAQINIFKAQEILQQSHIKFGAQNCHWETKGAFTGETSPEMLKSFNCKYALVGHSERRQYFNETNHTCSLKIKALNDAGMTPLYCVGETLKEREEGKTVEVLVTQIKEGLKNFVPSEPLVIAYEPVWAIGTGKVASSIQAEEAHKAIRLVLGDILGQKKAAEICILYGGSVKPENSQELSLQPNIDGFLVGGASLNAKSFAQIGQIPL